MRRSTYAPLAIAAMLAMGDAPKGFRGERERYHRSGTPPEVVAKLKAKAEAKRRRRARRNDR